MWDVVNAGRLTTHSNAIISATGTIYNGGAVRAGGDVTFTARRIDNTCDSLLVAGSRIAGENIVLSARAGSNCFCMVIVDKKYTKQG